MQNIETEQSLRCAAHECPYAWSVNAPDRGVNHLCQFHAWSDQHEWPRITQELLTDIAVRSYQPAPVPARPMSQEEKIATLKGLKKVLRSFAPDGEKETGWALALKARHDRGEKLNPNQIRCYKNALDLHPAGVQL